MTRRLPDRIPACLAVVAHSLLRTHDQPFSVYLYNIEREINKNGLMHTF